MKKIFLVTTSPLIVNFFLLPYLRHLRVLGRIGLVFGADDRVALKETCGADTHVLPIRREIAPWSDVVALIRLTLLFVRERPDVVHSFGPKAGLLAALAAWLARVPVRMHTFTGQVWATRSGFMRALLRAMDRLVATLDTHLLADSASQRRFLIESGEVDPRKCTVLASGSVSGVDTVRFRPDPAARSELRDALGIDPGATTFLFLGRITRDKGVIDLARAFSVAALDDACLVFVGPDEEGLQDEIESVCEAQRARLRFAPYTPLPERYLACADVLCLPSYREGFGSSIIEAAASGVPAIGSAIYGIEDAIVDSETGLLHPPGDADAIAACLRRLALDGALRAQLAAAAQRRAGLEFSEARVMSAVVEHYRAAVEDCS